MQQGTVLPLRCFLYFRKADRIGCVHNFFRREPGMQAELHLFYGYRVEPRSFPAQQAQDIDIAVGLAGIMQFDLDVWKSLMKTMVLIDNLVSIVYIQWSFEYCCRLQQLACIVGGVGVMHKGYWTG